MAIAGVAGYSLVMYHETVTLNQVKDVMQDLELAVNQVQALGEGNSVIVKIALPNGVTETIVAGQAIYITYTTIGTSSQSMVETNANVHGSLPISMGVHYIEVRSVDGNVSLQET